VAERPIPSGDAFLFALYDLDGFKFYNDSFGHPAGDLLLRRLGTNLARGVGRECAFRLGGDEFCVLTALEGRDPVTLAEIARSALSEKGEGFSVGASCGWAVLPDEAASSSEALRLVDGRMYAEKAHRSVRNAHQMQEIFRRVFQQLDPDMSAHFKGVTRLAADVARHLGLDSEEVDAISRAAELHDIGKIAIPEEILRKPGPLDPGEWDLMRRHTVIGDRILSASPAMKPVARLVRWSHERWDGLGYPDGLAGDQIPFGARLIAICDSYDAMTSERPYQEARTPMEAIAELRACADTQYDPELVEVFCSVVERRRDPAAV
jgi:two-component system cell cycle response regulator